MGVEEYVFTHILIMADALDKEDAKLGLSIPNLLYEELSPVNGAIGSIQDPDGAALM